MATPTWFGIDDLKTAAGLAQFTTPCNSAAKTLNWNAITDSFTCTDIAIGDSAITYANRTANQVFAGPASGGDAAPTFRALAEADIPNLSAGKITTGTLAAARIPDLDWSKITGEPTTLSGYGISDAVINGGQAGAVTVGSSNANSLALRTNGSDRMTLYSNGYIGVGSTSPSIHFQVSGPPVVAQTSAKHQLAIVDNATAHDAATPPIAGISFQGYYDWMNFRPFAAIHGAKESSSDLYKGYLSFITSRNPSGPMEAMRINSLGNVGIGMTNPAQRLVVNGIIAIPRSSDGAQYLGLYSTTDALNIENAGNQTDSSILFNTGGSGTFGSGSTRMSIMRNGNVGIGTSSPTTRFSVVGAGGAGSPVASFQSDPTHLPLILQTYPGPYSQIQANAHYNGTEFVRTQTGTITALRLMDAAGGITFATATSGAAGSTVNGLTDRMTITNSGNVGIGTTSPASLFHTSGNGGSAIQIFDTYRSDGFGSVIYRRAARGSSTTPTASITSDQVASHVGFAHNGTGFSNIAAMIFSADGAQTTSSAPGAISLSTVPSGSLSLVERLKITSGGNVGIGTTSPSAKLDVAGTIKSQLVNVTAPASGFDWSQGNIQYTSSSCTGAVWPFTNISDGTTYTLAIQGTTHTGTCSFSSSGLTFKYSPTNATPTNGKDVIYTFMKVGSTVYVSWIDGW